MSESSDSRNILLGAAKAWDVTNEPIESVNARIHDGVPITALQERARNYLVHSETVFPAISSWKFPRVLEIGSGVGFILEAIEEKTRACKDRHIIGLDISESMIAMAKERLRSNHFFQNGEIDFLLYDGVRIPAPDQSFDFICSFAALQHIPKPFVYNLFFEIRRLLKPKQYAVLHLASFGSMLSVEKHFPWRGEIDQQINNRPGSHWHHYYSREELEAVFKVTGFDAIEIADGYFACVGTH